MNFGEIVTNMNPEVISHLEKWLTTMSPEYFQKAVADQNKSFPKKLLTEMYNEIVNELDIESEQVLSLVQALKFDLEKKPSDALITEISNSFVDFILRSVFPSHNDWAQAPKGWKETRKSEKNKRGTLSFSNMAELNLFIRKMIGKGHRDSAIGLIQTIIERIEIKNKVIQF